MKASVPLLAPLLRSDTQGRLLAELYLHPGRERTTTELAALADTALANASREVRRLVDAGFLLARSSGRNKYLRVNEEHPLFRPVAEILRHAYGPVAVLGPLLRDVPGVDEAYVFGPWAARLAGETGAEPGDVDVLVIGDALDHGALDAAMAAARRMLGREVAPLAVSHRAWAEQDDAFLRDVRDGHLVSVPLGEAARERRLALDAGR